MPNEDQSVVEKLRLQRDRFIAFAFAGADLLLELDGEDVVAYSAGAGEALYGLSDQDLLGKRLEDFILPRDRKKFAEALQRLHNSGRLDHTPLSVMGSSGTVSRMRMAGIKLPQFPHGYHLVMSRVPPMVVTEQTAGVADPKVDFVDMVRQRLNDGNRLGEDYTLTLFDFSKSKFGKAEPATVQTFLATLHHELEECSVRKSSAGQIHSHAFGLVHDQKVSAAEVKRKVSEVASRFGGKMEGSAVTLRGTSLELDDSSMTEEDVTKALSYIVNTFVRDSAQFALKSLAEGARVAVEDTLTRVRNFRAMVKGGKLAFMFQPIVNLHTGGVLKYEAFARIIHNGAMFAPSHIIPFATDVGVIGEFDLAALKKALEMMKAATEISPLAHISVNVSGTSFGNPAFYSSLLKLLEGNKALMGRLIIEITDAASIYNLDEARRLLTRIKRLGARLSLDDYGQGGSAFDILRALPVDYAKIDAPFIIDARDKKGKSVLRAMTGLCQDLGITTIGECVEDEQMLNTLREVGVDYAQGHLFAQPAADAAKKIRYFKEHVKEAAAS